MFSLFKRRPLLSQEENEKVVNAIRNAEMRTSGEIRVFIESKCKFIDALDRAKEIFTELKMENTASRNGVLLYAAIRDRQLAIYGDAGIHERLGEEYWQKEVNIMIHHFHKENYAEGLCRCIGEIGEALYKHFPYDKDTDKNELSDDIVFGK